MSQTQTWFIYEGGKVIGPLTTDQVNLMSAKGQIATDAFIWWRGQREWRPISFWRDQLQEILDSVVTQTQKAIWHIHFNNKVIGPLTQSKLIENLRVLPDLANVELRTEGMDTPKKLFEMHDVMELLGIDRREFERTPLMADVKVNRTRRAPRQFVLSAAGISEGGIGLTGTHDLQRGDEITISVASPSLGGKMQLQGEVIYVSMGGFAGIRFQNVTAESHAIIVDYVRRFEIKEERKVA